MLLNPVSGGRTPEELNQCFRDVCNGWTAEQRRCLESEFGVGTRTVQRWCSPPGTQQRNFVPLNPPSPFDDPVGFDAYTARRSFAEFVCDGAVNRQGSETPNERFVECFQDPCAAKRFMDALARKELDPWINECWRSVKLTNEGGQICLDIEYERSCISGAVREAA